MKPRKMKDSGIPWIGEIPEGWSSTKIKYSFQVNAEKLPENTADDFEFEYIDISSVNDLGKIISPSKMEFQDAPSRARMVVRKGDVIISTVRTYLRAIAQIDENNRYVCSTGFAVLRPRPDVDSRYAFYQMQSESIIQSIVSRSVGVSYPAISPTELAATRILHPHIEEQKRIAAYLDGKCGEIDRVIAAKERQNELLKAQRAAVIHEAVTRGLNPKAKFKDSGVEWIGKIPSTWWVKRLKHVLKQEKGALRVGPFGSQLQGADFSTTGFRVYDQRAVLDNDFRNGDKYVLEDKYNDLSAFTVMAGDILLTTRGTIGRVAIVPEDAEEGIIHPCLIRFRINEEEVDSRFIAYLFNGTTILAEQFSYFSNATTIEVIYSDVLKNVYIPCPSLPEQRRIAAHLDARCGEIDRVMAANEKMVAKLKEYRGSLIWEAVTGKVAV